MGGVHEIGSGLVSALVNSAHNDAPRCIEPIALTPPAQGSLFPR